jgi:hypothetical protein
MGFTQPLTEMSMGNIPEEGEGEDKVWQVRKADNLASIREPIF